MIGSSLVVVLYLSMSLTSSGFSFRVLTPSNCLLYAKMVPWMDLQSPVSDGLCVLWRDNVQVLGLLHRKGKLLQSRERNFFQ